MSQPKTPASFHPGLDKNSNVPLYLQIAHRLAQGAEEGVLQPGMKVPSIRALSAELKVSPDTVKEAYRELQAQGILRSKKNSGFYVGKPFFLAASPKKGAASEIQSAAPLTPQAEFAVQAARKYRPNQGSNIPFSVYGTGLVPAFEKEWTKIAASVAKSPWLHAGYTDPQGYLPLRKAISERLLQYRGVKTDPDEIIITNGSIQSLNLIAKLLFAPGEGVGVESPAPSIYTEVLSFAGLKTVGIPVDGEGLDTDALAERISEVKGVFVSPANQNPMSSALSLERRESLSRLAKAHKFWIIEDDMENLAWQEHPMPPLAQDPSLRGRLIYMDSFSLQFFPGIKLGYLAVPKEWAKAFAGAKLLTDRALSEQLQVLMAHFLSSPSYDAHLRKMRRLFSEGFSSMREAVQRHLQPYGHLSNTKCGSHMTFFLNPEFSDAEISEKLRRQNIATRFLSGFAHSETQRPNGLMLGFGTFSPLKIEQGIMTIKEVLETVRKGK